MITQLRNSIFLWEVSLSWNKWWQAEHLACSLPLSFRLAPPQLYLSNAIVQTPHLDLRISKDIWLGLLGDSRGIHLFLLQFSPITSSKGNPEGVRDPQKLWQSKDSTVTSDKGWLTHFRPRNLTLNLHPSTTSSPPALPQFLLWALFQKIAVSCEVSFHTSAIQNSRGRGGRRKSLVLSLDIQ